MKLCPALMVIFLMVATTGSALASVSKIPPLEQYTPDMKDGFLPPAQFGRPASDTVYFGGLDPATGLAREGYVWDWDTDIGADPLQGWHSEDETVNPGVYFGRVTSADFSEDPCNPMFLTPNNVGQLWLGIHEEEANHLDFIAGMGYLNNMCQYATSPEYAINPTTQAVNITFLYFNDSEFAFDYTYVQLLCYNSSHVQLPGAAGTFEANYLDGIIGSPAAPATYTRNITAGVLDGATRFIRLRFRFESDGLASDEDGQWDSACGPFSCDDLTITVGTTPNQYNWNAGAQNWTFDRCPGIGTYMGIADASVWSEWLEFAGVLCECHLSGNAIEFVDEVGSPDWPPGHPVGQIELAVSNVIARAGTPYQPPDYNTTIGRWHQYVWLRYAAGTFYRPGWMMWPYSSEGYPETHWSRRLGQDVWIRTGDTPDCYLSGVNFSSPPDGTPIPAAWDSLRATFEVITSCDQFGIPPQICQYEGVTYGSPVIDNFKIGLTGAADAPAITLDTGSRWQDGFGQNFPFYLEPCDVGNSDITYDISRDDEYKNDWLADTSTVVGPTVTDESSRWACDLCLKINKKGPCQDRVPGYAEWKARFNGDPEAGWVCSRMDSLRNLQGVWPHKYNSYFHEDDPGFNPSFADRTPQQEIMPDGIFTPGTEVQYKYRSYWWNGGAPPIGYFEYPTSDGWEFGILPGMVPAPPPTYDWVYPSVLYIDAFNAGSEYYIVPVLDQMGIPYDKYDAWDASSNWDAPLKRSFGGTWFNPGGWGNNGATENQLLAYRLILLNSGVFGQGFWTFNMPDLSPSFVILQNWLESTDCELGTVRRGLIMNGDEIAFAMAAPDGHPDFLNNTLGTTLVAEAYRDYNDDQVDCVWLEPTPAAEFAPEYPGIGVYGNACPAIYNYNVLGVQSGVSGTAGNLRYYSYLGSGTSAYVNYAEVVRENTVPGVSNWKSVVDGFSLHHLSERNCNGEDCSTDSVCVINGAAHLLEPMLTWMGDPTDPFVLWRYPCLDTGVDDDSESHPAGPVTYLFNGRPNPFSGSVTLRFSLANDSKVNIGIFDVSGRLIRTLVDNKMTAGEHTLAWDGADNGGHWVGSGIFWVQMATGNGYVSAKRMVVLK